MLVVEKKNPHTSFSVASTKPLEKQNDDSRSDPRSRKEELIQKKKGKEKKNRRVIANSDRGTEIEEMERSYRITLTTTTSSSSVFFF